MSNRSMEFIESNSVPEPNSGCWIWTRPLTSSGYARIWSEGKMEQVHRLAYEMVNGQIPDGMDIDHLCRVHCCVNPSHLEAVTHSVNVLRGLVPTRSGKKNAAKTQCHRGHEYTVENTVFDRKHNRSCRECRRLACAEYYLRKKGRRL